MLALVVPLLFPFALASVPASSLGGTGAARTWIVDASGLGGAGLLPVPDVAPHHLCAAAQEIREVRDAAAARAYFDAHQLALEPQGPFAGEESAKAVTAKILNNVGIIIKMLAAMAVIIALVGIYPSRH